MARCAEGSAALPWRPAGLAAAALVAAGPPAAFAGAEFAVLPGLALLYRAIGGRGGFALGYAIGATHLACVSWSLHHVLFPAYVVVAVVGGLYTAVLAPAWRGLAALRVPRPLAFALALTGTCWLRAHMPEVHYPHAQPAHALHRWPALLGPSTWGGEALVNFVLAAAAAGLAEWWGTRRRLPAALALAAVLLLAVPGPPRGATLPLDVLAVQPGFGVEEILDRDQAARAARAWQALAVPTLAAAGPAATDPPDLVLWPESCAFVDLVRDRDRFRLVESTLQPAGRRLALHPGVRLLVGSQMHAPAREGTPVALLLDADGRYLGHHEKQRLVPGGERQPFVDWLPAAWNHALRAGMSRALGLRVPHLEPGEPRDPLPVVDGVRAAGILCFDNAFEDVAAAQARAGANVLAVLSNEAWYRGGGELAQMEAMSVLRALETGVPVVRATMDGTTLAIDGRGRVLGRLPHGARDSLRVILDLPRSSGPVAPAARFLGPLAALALAFGLAQAAAAWARLCWSRLRTRFRA